MLLRLPAPAAVVHVTISPVQRVQCACGVSVAACKRKRSQNRGGCCPDCMHVVAGTLTTPAQRGTLPALARSSPLLGALSKIESLDPPTPGKPPAAGAHLQGPVSVRGESPFWPNTPLQPAPLRYNTGPRNYPERPANVTQGEVFVRHLAFDGGEGAAQLARCIREGIRRAKLKL